MRQTETWEAARVLTACEDARSLLIKNISHFLVHDRHRDCLHDCIFLIPHLSWDAREIIYLYHDLSLVLIRVILRFQKFLKFSSASLFCLVRFKKFRWITIAFENNYGLFVVLFHLLGLRIGSFTCAKSARNGSSIILAGSTCILMNVPQILCSRAFHSLLTSKRDYRRSVSFTVIFFLSPSSNFICLTIFQKSQCCSSARCFHTSM